MREIKFRAWDNKKKVMMPHVAILGIEEGFITDFTRDYLHNSMDWNGQNGYAYDFIPMQFTGRHDSNKQEIYEGDLIVNSTGIVFEIFYDKVLAAFRCRRDDHSEKYMIELPISEKYWVKGNIYENPELLKP